MVQSRHSPFMPVTFAPEALKLYDLKAQFPQARGSQVISNNMLLGIYTLYL